MPLLLLLSSATHACCLAHSIIYSSPIHLFIPHEYSLSFVFVWAVECSLSEPPEEGTGPLPQPPTILFTLWRLLI